MSKFCPVCMVWRAAPAVKCSRCSADLVARPVPSDCTAGDRKARYREARRAEGLKQVSAWVPEHAAADFQILAQALRENPGLTWGPLKEVKSGKLVSASRILTGPKS